MAEESTENQVIRSFIRILTWITLTFISHYRKEANYIVRFDKKAFPFFISLVFIISFINYYRQKELYFYKSYFKVLSLNMIPFTVIPKLLFYLIALLWGSVGSITDIDAKSGISKPYSNSGIVYLFTFALMPLETARIHLLSAMGSLVIARQIGFSSCN